MSETRPARAVTISTAVLLLGCAALLIPTMLEVAQVSWSTEQGGHGPIVLVTGIWLLIRELKNSPATSIPKPLWGMFSLAVCLSVYIGAKITGIIEIQAFAMYGAFISGLYLLAGGALLRTLWFPLIYLALVLPPPESVVAAVTQPIKIAISEWAVTLLHGVGYPIASSGVTIVIAQYELLVAAACAGLNSIISLSAICLFYIYIRHRADMAPFALVLVAIIPVAVLSNFVRVITLILITYYFGEAAAQGFLHGFAGILMFAVALATIFGIDFVFTRLRDRVRTRANEAPRLAT